MSEFIKIPASKLSFAKRKLVHGVGINDANYIVSPKIRGKQTWCPIYVVWVNMLQRCYSRTFQEKKPTYTDCLVSNEWLRFSTFREWALSQDWAGKELDKDILIAGNKVYGPKTCIFVSGPLNRLFLDCAASRGDFPQGVSFNKNAGAFTASCSINGTPNYLGLFKTQVDAEIAYLEIKSSLIKDAVNSEEARLSGRLKAALLLRLDELVLRAMVLSFENKMAQMTIEHNKRLASIMQAGKNNEGCL